MNGKFPITKHGEEIKKMISLTEGNTGLSVQMLQNDSFENKHFEEYQNWMRLCYSSNIIEITKWVNQRSKKGEGTFDISTLLLKMIRNCLVFNFLIKTNCLLLKMKRY